MGRRSGSFGKVLSRAVEREIRRSLKPSPRSRRRTTTPAYAPSRSTAPVFTVAADRYPEIQSRKSTFAVATAACFALSLGAAALSKVAPAFGEIGGAGVLISFLLFLVAIATPSRASLASKEFARRKQEYESCAQVLENPTLEDLEELDRLQASLELTTEEVGVRVAQKIADIRRVLEIRQAILASKDPPTLPGHDEATGGSACYFVAPTSVTSRGKTFPAALHVTDAGLLFSGSPGLELPWGEIDAIEARRLDLDIMANGRKTPIRVECRVFGVAETVDILAKRLRPRAARTVALRATRRTEVRDEGTVENAPGPPVPGGRL